MGIAVSDDILTEGRHRMETDEFEERLYQNELTGIAGSESLLYARIDLEQNHVECYDLFGEDRCGECKTMEYVTRDIFQRICMEESRVRFIHTFRTQNFLRLYQEHTGWIKQELKLRCSDGLLRWVELIARILREPSTSRLFVFLYGTSIDRRKKLELSCQISIKKEGLFYTQIGIEALMDTVQRKNRNTKENGTLILADLSETWEREDERCRHLIMEADYLLYQKLKDIVLFCRLKNGRLMMYQYTGMARSTIRKLLREIRKQFHEMFDDVLYEGYRACFTTAVLYLNDSNLDFEKNAELAMRLLKKGCESGKDKDHLQENQQDQNRSFCIGQGLKVSGCIMDELDELIFLIDVHTYQIVYVNRAAQRKLGMERSQILHQKCYQVIHGYHSPCYSCKNHMPVSDHFHMWKCTSSRLRDTYFIKDRLMQWEGKEVRFEIFYTTHQFPEALIPKESEAMKTAVEVLVENRDCEAVLDNLLSELCRYYGAESAGIFLHSKGYLDVNELIYPKERRQNPIQGSGIYGVHYALKDGDEVIGQLELYGSAAVNQNMDIIRFYTYVCNVQLLRNHAAIRENYIRTHDMRSGARNLISLYRYIEDMSEETIASAGVICIGTLQTEMIDPGETRAYIKELVEHLLEVYTDHEIYQLRGDRVLILLLEYSRKEFDMQYQKLNRQLDERFISEYFFRSSQIDIMDMITQVMLLSDSMARKYQQEGQGHQLMFQKMSRELQEDIETGNYMIYLQPKADMEGNIKGAEALIRCVRENHLIPPSSFVDRFEELDLIGRIDLFVFEEVCKLQKKWQKEGTCMPVSFNFSRMTLIDKELIQKIETIRKRYGIEKKYLEIEITETVGSISAEIIDDIANRLVEYGYPLSLDDFGARYSNLSILAEVAFHTLKLDKEIIDDIHIKPKVREIVKSVIQVCHDMRIQVVAEGVENAEQMETLREMGCDLIQGYYVNKPVSVELFEKQYKV